MNNEFIIPINKFLKPILFDIEASVKNNTPVSYLTSLGFNMKTKKDTLKSIRHYGYDDSDNYVEVIYIKKHYYIIYSFTGDKRAITASSLKNIIFDESDDHHKETLSNFKLALGKGVLTNNDNYDVFHVYLNLLRNSFINSYPNKIFEHLKFNKDSVSTNQNFFDFSFIKNKSKTVSKSFCFGQTDYSNLRGLIYQHHLKTKNINSITSEPERKRIINKLVKKIIYDLIQKVSDPINPELLVRLNLRESISINSIIHLLDKDISKKYHGTFFEFVEFCQKNVFPRVLQNIIMSQQLSKTLLTNGPHSPKYEYSLLTFFVDDFQHITQNCSEDARNFISLTNILRNDDFEDEPFSWGAWSDTDKQKIIYQANSPFIGNFSFSENRFLKKEKNTLKRKFYRIKNTQIRCLIVVLSANYISKIK